MLSRLRILAVALLVLSLAYVEYLAIRLATDRTRQTEKFESLAGDFSRVEAKIFTYGRGSAWFIDGLHLRRDSVSVGFEYDYNGQHHLSSCYSFINCYADEPAVLALTGNGSWRDKINLPLRTTAFVLNRSDGRLAYLELDAPDKAENYKVEVQVRSAAVILVTAMIQLALVWSIRSRPLTPNPSFKRTRLRRSA